MLNCRYSGSFELILITFKLRQIASAAEYGWTDGAMTYTRYWINEIGIGIGAAGCRAQGRRNFRVHAAPAICFARPAGALLGRGGGAVGSDSVAQGPRRQPRGLLVGGGNAGHKLVSPGGGQQGDAKGHDCKQAGEGSGRKGRTGRQSVRVCEGAEGRAGRGRPAATV